MIFQTAGRSRCVPNRLSGCWRRRRHLGRLFLRAACWVVGGARLSVPSWARASKDSPPALSRSAFFNTHHPPNPSLLDRPTFSSSHHGHSRFFLHPQDHQRAHGASASPRMTTAGRPDPTLTLPPLVPVVLPGQLRPWLARACRTRGRYQGDEVSAPV
jgi:hypothetical protein